jgi:valyl-tRNA synthetase
VTEELWGRLRDACRARPPGFAPSAGWGEALIAAPWPAAEPDRREDAEDIRRFDLLREAVRMMRNARAEKNVNPKYRAAAWIAAGSESDWLNEQADVLASGAGLDPDRLTITSAIDSPPTGALPMSSGELEIYLELTESIDSSAEGERLARQLETVEGQIERLRGLLAGPFATRAPAEIVETERQKLSSAEEEAERLRAQLRSLADK